MSQATGLSSVLHWFREDNYSPWRVGMSMCASWSLGVSMAAGLTLLSIWGFAPFVVWMTFNVLTVPIFAIMYVKFPNLREFINFRLGQVIMLFVLVAYITLNLNAMTAVLGSGIELVTYQFTSNTMATGISMGLSALIFVFIYFTGLSGSVKTDIFQYFLQIGGCFAIIGTGLYMGTPGVEVPAAADPSVYLLSATAGLLSGPYVEPAQWQRIEKAPQIETGLWAGLFFAFYMIGVVGSALTFGPSNVLHGVLLVIVVFSVSTSTMDSTAAAFNRILNNKELSLVVGLIGVGVYPIFGGAVGSSWAAFAEYRAVISGTIITIAVLLTILPGVSAETLKTRFDVAEDEVSRIIAEADD